MEMSRREFGSRFALVQMHWPIVGDEFCVGANVMSQRWRGFLRQCKREAYEVSAVLGQPLFDSPASSSSFDLDNDTVVTKSRRVGGVLMAVVGFDTNACSSGEEANTTRGNRNSLEIIAAATMVN